jgi:uncharacterized membrane protein
MVRDFRRAALTALLACPGLLLACASEPDDAGASTASHFPCEVEDVIQAKCQRCHQQPPENGAPFPLLTWEDTQKMYGVQLVYEAMLPAVETDFMPYTQIPLDPPVEPLTPQEKALLLDWLADGALPSFDAACN